MPLCSAQRDSCCWERCPEHPLWLSSSRAAHGKRRKVDLLLSQMHLSHSGLGSWDDVAVTQRSELSLAQGTSLIKVKQRDLTSRNQQQRQTALTSWVIGSLGWRSGPAGFLPSSGDSSSEIVLCILCGHLLASQQTFEPHQH